MSIGYACLTIGVPFTNIKSCIIKNASDSRLQEIILYNLNSLENIIDYNITHQIKLFRISSDIIPFGSNAVNKLPWWDIFSNQFEEIGDKIQYNNMRVSLHPGQYTVLNSPKEDVVSKAILDLNYHTKVLDNLRLGPDHKIVLHIGGVYNDKEQSIQRFISNFRRLDDSVKDRLVIENDDKLYNISEVLEISEVLGVPVIFDNLHNKINSSDEDKSEFEWIESCRKTWKLKDGKQKIHYSQQNPLKVIGSHSDTIKINEFMNFYKILNRKDIDIMLEVKDKNLSAVKCINCTTNNKSLKPLELEWKKYKYTVLEKSPENYTEIQELLNDNNNYSAVRLYNLIEDVLENEYEIKHQVNAAQYILSLFEDIATEKEVNLIMEYFQMFLKSEISIQKIKKSLWKLTEKYQLSELLDSYYFVIP